MSIADLGMIAVIYLVAILSPGPATLAIAAASLSSGRRTGLWLAFGVITGSVAWSMVAAFGLGALMLAHAWMLMTVKILGGAYLIFLAVKSARSAMRLVSTDVGAGPELSALHAYRRGLIIHLTNPKAVLFWGALFSLVVEPGQSVGALLSVLAMCNILGLLSFSGYALLFSVPGAMAIYARARRGFEVAFALVFGAAGVGLLALRVSP